MHNSLKGALAAVAGGTLLLGGAGSLAYWTDEGAAAGTAISSGTLDLGTPSCSGWLLDGPGLPAARALGTKKIVPGEVVTQVCTFTVDAQGEHLAATFDVSSPTWVGPNDLSDELSVAAAYRVNSTDVDGVADTIVDDDVITATVTVTFDGNGVPSNDSRSLSTALDTITITATQTHTA